MHGSTFMTYTCACMIRMLLVSIRARNYVRGMRMQQLLSTKKCFADCKAFEGTLIAAATVAGVTGHKCPLMASWLINYAWIWKLLIGIHANPCPYALQELEDFASISRAASLAGSRRGSKERSSVVARDGLPIDPTTEALALVNRRWGKGHGATGTPCMHTHTHTHTHSHTQRS